MLASEIQPLAATALFVVIWLQTRRHPDAHAIIRQHLKWGLAGMLASALLGWQGWLAYAVLLGGGYAALWMIGRWERRLKN
jgi:hypothetical protein